MPTNIHIPTNKNKKNKQKKILSFSCNINHFQNKCPSRLLLHETKPTPPIFPNHPFLYTYFSTPTFSSRLTSRSFLIITSPSHTHTYCTDPSPKPTLLNTLTHAYLSALHIIAAFSPLHKHPISQHTLCCTQTSQDAPSFHRQKHTHTD